MKYSINSTLKTPWLTLDLYFNKMSCFQNIFSPFPNTLNEKILTANKTIYSGMKNIYRFGINGLVQPLKKKQTKIMKITRSKFKPGGESVRPPFDEWNLKDDLMKMDAADASSLSLFLNDTPQKRDT